MSKITNLPKVKSSGNADRLVVVQNGITKSISKKDFLSELLRHITSLTAKLNLQKSSKGKISSDNPVFSTPISAPSPKSKAHLTTKHYVDSLINAFVRRDGSTPLLKSLEYEKDFSLDFTDNSVVSKKYADKLLDGVLKTLETVYDNSLPKASKGDCFVMSESYPVFAQDGPEIQEGDVLICINDSEGGFYSRAGHQFAIINTNVVNATEKLKGVVRIATLKDMDNYAVDDAAITPFKYKYALDNSAIYKRTLVDRNSYPATEHDRGILGVDGRKYGKTTITLPSIVSLKEPELFKVTVKDEYGQAGSNSITVKAKGSSIDGKNEIVLINDYQAVTFYNDGSDYYIENNTHEDAVSGTFRALTGLQAPGSTGSFVSIYSFDIDLSQFSLGQGFKIETWGFFAANANAKQLKITVNDVDGTINSDITSPNSKRFRADLIVLKEPRYWVAIGSMYLDDEDPELFISNGFNIGDDGIISINIMGNAATTNTDIHVYAATLQSLK